MTAGETADIRFKLELGDRTMEATVQVPQAAMALPALLPVLHAFDDALMTVAESRARKKGRPVSCREGCGACCRQMAPVSEAEARHLFDYVAELPEEHRESVRERFRMALEKLEGAGLGEGIRAIPRETEEREALALAYFRLGIPCPFLENERCTVYSRRPMSCREYLVSSPPAECSNPTPERVERVPTVARGSQVLYSWVQGEARYLPLVLALEWVEKNPQAQYPVAPGSQIFRAFLSAIQKQAQEK